MAARLIGTDSANPKLPDGVVTATGLVTLSAGDTRYVNTAGDTMGALTATGPVNAQAGVQIGATGSALHEDGSATFAGTVTANDPVNAQAGVQIGATGSALHEDGSATFAGTVTANDPVNAQAGVQIGATGTALHEDGSATIAEGLNVADHVQFTVEQASVALPAANRCRLFIKDNGAGKTQLMAQFATGAAVQIAIQP